MRFDSSPETQRLVYKTVAVGSSRVLRTGMIRIDATLDEISKVEGRAEWISQAQRSMDNSGMNDFLKVRVEAIKKSPGSIAPKT